MSVHPDHIVTSVVLTPKADKIQELADLFVANAKVVKDSEPGVVLYTVSVATSEEGGPTRVMLLIVFANQAARDAHIETEHYKAAKARDYKEFLVEKPEFAVLKHHGGFMPGQ